MKLAARPARRWPSPWPPLAATAPGGARSRADTPAREPVAGPSRPVRHVRPGQLQRGFKVYREVCAACHSLNLLAFRNLGRAGRPRASPRPQVKALAAEYQVPDGPDEPARCSSGPATPSDRMPATVPERPAARAANGGALPPDLSLIAKARAGRTARVIQLFTRIGGPDYITRS